MSAIILKWIKVIKTLCVCVRTHVHMHVCAHTRVHMHVCAGGRRGGEGKEEGRKIKQTGEPRLKIYGVLSILEMST